MPKGPKNLGQSPRQELEVGPRGGPCLLVLVKTTFMLKLLEAIRKKAFSVAAAGGFLIDRRDPKAENTHSFYILN